MNQVLFKRQSGYRDVEREFGQLDKRLLKTIEMMSHIAWVMWGDHLVVTRIKQVLDDGSTHFKQSKPYRFIDIAILESGMENSETLRKIINVLFPYGAKGFLTIPSLNHGTAPHFHIQVRPRS